MLKFRKLLNDNKLGQALFAQVGQVLQSKGFMVNTGTIVQTTIQLARPVRPRTQTRRTTPRGIKPARVSNGISA